MYARTTTILDRLSSTITPGALALVVGLNGSGKTTLQKPPMVRKRGAPYLKVDGQGDNKWTFAFLSTQVT